MTKDKKVKLTDEGPTSFLEASLKIITKKVTLPGVQLNQKMKLFAKAMRLVLHHFTETIDEFTPVALKLDKKDKTYVLSTDKTSQEITVAGLVEFIKLFPGLVAPKVIHLTDILKIEKMVAESATPEKKE